MSRVLVRPSRTVPADWLWAGPAAAVALPAAVPDDAVAAFLAREADAVLLNEGLLRHRPAAFARWARWDEAAGALVLAPEVVAAARFVADGPRPRYALVDVARLPR